MLAAAVARLEQVVEGTKGSGSPDSQAAQLEIFHEIQQQLRLLPRDEIKAAQSKLESCLTSALLQGPAAPIRNLISSIYVLAFSRGARQSIYTTVGLLLSWMTSTAANKTSPASSVNSKAAILQVLGELSEAHGAHMVSLCADTITLLTKTIRASELPLRAPSLHALGSALEGSGGVAPAVQQEILKNLKHIVGERGAPPELRVATMQCMAPLVRNAENLWGGDTLEQLAPLCIKHLDDPACAVRAAASKALSSMLAAALSVPFRARSSSGSAPPRKSGFSRMAKGVLDSRKDEPKSAIETLVPHLVAPFCRTSATKELRQGVARAFVHMLRHIPRPDLERHSAYILEQCLTMLSLQGAGRQVYDCVTHILRAGLGETLSERGQIAMASTLAGHVTARTASEGVISTGLKEVAALLLHLREVAVGARDALLQGERPLLVLVEHPARVVKLAACQCLWALVLAFPPQLAGLLNTSLNRVRVEHAKLSAAPGKGTDATLATLHAHAHAVAALVGAIPHTPFGAPHMLTSSTLSAASDLAASGNERCNSAAWLMLRSMMVLDPEWMGAKQRLSKMYSMWKGALAAKVEIAGKDQREAVEAELRMRAEALASLTAFIQQMPEAYSAPLLRPVVGSLLPSNTALLGQCRDNAQAMMSPSFRAAFMNFRARLYDLLSSIPSSAALSAKLLNVVMPMVVADIVDPANSAVPMSSPLLPILSESDNRLGSGGEDDRICEPLATGVIPDAEMACDWLVELKGGQESPEEALALGAALRLFAIVFRQQTSDVRLQLLGHLGTAASKATASSSKTGGFLGGGGGDSKPSSVALTNVCAAMLGSLEQMRKRPSKSPLKADLIDSIHLVLTPCVLDQDVSVRRGAAQCVGLLAQLLDSAFSSNFVVLAQSKLNDGKLKDESRAGLALAIGKLASGAGSTAILKQVVGLLAEMATDTSPIVCEWATHALGSLAEEVGESFRAHLGTCLGVASSLLLSEPPPNLHSAQAIARLSAGLLTSLLASPDLAFTAGAGGKPAATMAKLVRRFGVLNAAACAIVPQQRLDAEVLHFARLSLELPQPLLPPLAAEARAKLLPEQIVNGLASAEPSRRRAALQCQRVLCELEAEKHQDSGLVSTLFDLLEREPSAEALAEAKRTLLYLLHAGVPSFWLKTLKGIVLMDKKKKEKRVSPYESRDDDAEAEGEEESGGVGASGLPAGDSTEESEESRRRQKEAEMESEEAAKWEFIAPRWATRLFAVECVQQLLNAHAEPEQFSLMLAREAGPRTDLLVHLLPELISVAFTAATGAVEAIRPAGIITLIDVVCKFGHAFDPDYEGHLLLEQYHAQIAAALRPCFAPEAEPSLAAAGCALASQYTLVMASTAYGHEVDPVAVRKMVALLTKLIGDGLQQIQFPAFSETAATMVRAAALQGAAQLQQAAQQENSAVPEISSQLHSALPMLRDCWMALLRDFSFLRTQHADPRGRAYRPHLYSPSCASASRQRLLHAWAPTLEAVCGLVGTPAWKEGRATAKKAEDMAPKVADDLMPIEPRDELEDLELLLGLSVRTLAQICEDTGAGELSSEELEECVLCVAALQRLLVPEALLTPHVLPSQPLLALVALLQRAASHPSNKMRDAIARLACHINAHVAPYMHAASDAQPLFSALQRLASTPLLLALPYLSSAHSFDSHAVAPIASQDVPCVTESILALAKLPGCMATPEQRLRHMFTPALLLLHVCHAAAASSPPLAPVCDACLQAARVLIALVDPADEAIRARLATLWLGALESALTLCDVSPVPHRLPMLKLVLLLLNAVPPSAEASRAFEKVYGALRAMLQADPAAQGVALQALQAYLQESASAPSTPQLRSHLRLLVPEVAQLLLSSVADGAADKPAAVKVLLLVCTLAPAEALVTCLSIVLPLLVGCMWLAADGAPSATQKELSALAHASFTALAKRSPNEFRSAVGSFSPGTRSRMETALRESAAVTAQPAPGAINAPAAPKIALKMDFSGFGKK
ncbi:hypothetical protein AB1Y20_022238 [Prymnesium parvum]|uniref:LAA1-like C-terminal TPR repeats domain-containing protein n=1 Tax=Prymnesium parvum TaxID=97485 RepID=A0AB34JHT4_PRYPA